MSKVSFFVLDEADRMLDMGFSEDIMKIAAKLPKTCQTIMFSATMPPKIEDLAKTLLKDPVEIKQEEMLQLQLNEAIGMTYDSLIKLSLRHRPDLLLIGEIRDTETARAVIRASLTGVTVFSTIHAKSIPGVYERLLELGVSEDTDVSQATSGQGSYGLSFKGSVTSV